MYTSFLAVTLMTAPIVAALESPEWLKNYSAAMEVGQRLRKPVAVFVGSGPQGEAGLVKEGEFSADMLKVLAQSYVCVYLDRSQTANQRLAEDLSISTAGVVISDRTGTYQAFHHNGTISQADLTQRLRQFADPNLVVSNTVSNAIQRVSYYGGAGAGYQATFSSQQYIPTRTVNC
jgi:hypothetical protein